MHELAISQCDFQATVDGRDASDVLIANGSVSDFETLWTQLNRAPFYGAPVLPGGSSSFDQGAVQAFDQALQQVPVVPVVGNDGQATALGKF